jgi:hypothetical protein
MPAVGVEFFYLISCLGIFSLGRKMVRNEWLP